ncbi:MAG: FKBP-type peptidyl-prolyl cis-trans isomerase [Chitinophagaceae bacterium]|nr:FKBP-type peptidyl-prolyl cis-trans isomerase [Chitinophagaceae bacterium]
MRKIVLLSATVLLFSGCIKTNTGNNSCPYQDDNIIVPAGEIQALEAYLSGQGITNTTKHSGSFYYKVQTQGIGNSAGLCNQIVIKYKGSLTNGNVFDQTPNTPGSDTRVFILGELIPGWKKGIPLIQQGGKITLYLPPSLGYGASDIKDNSGNVVIPGNSILIFEVELVAIG